MPFFCYSRSATGERRRPAAVWIFRRLYIARRRQRPHGGLVVMLLCSSSIALYNNMLSASGGGGVHPMRQRWQPLSPVDARQLLVAAAAAIAGEQRCRRQPSAYNMLSGIALCGGGNARWRALLPVAAHALGALIYLTCSLRLSSQPDRDEQVSPPARQQQQQQRRMAYLRHQRQQQRQRRFEGGLIACSSSSLAVTAAQQQQACAGSSSSGNCADDSSSSSSMRLVASVVWPASPATPG